jgi:hypothetical protein
MSNNFYRPWRMSSCDLRQLIAPCLKGAVLLWALSQVTVFSVQKLRARADHCTRCRFFGKFGQPSKFRKVLLIYMPSRRRWHSFSFADLRSLSYVMLCLRIPHSLELERVCE